jgi:preprotein translocase subunit SecF
MAIEALFYAVLLITVYISGRFEHSWFIAGAMALVLWGAVYGAGYFGFNRLFGVGIGMVITLLCCWKLKLNFALGAILALMHDVAATLGLLTLMGVEIDLNVIAALLTLVGYSINDTIVVYDRIRENLRAVPHDIDAKPSMADIINKSVNQTLSRTIMTSATTLVASLALYLLGGSEKTAAYMKQLTPHLTEEEAEVYKRGRNTKVNSASKHSTLSDYHEATGMEALFGYLHLAGQQERIAELFDAAYPEN